MARVVPPPSRCGVGAVEARIRASPRHPPIPTGRSAPDPADRCEDEAQRPGRVDGRRSSADSRTSRGDQSVLLDHRRDGALAWKELGSFGALWSTDYGRALLIKIGLVLSSSSARRTTGSFCVPRIERTSSTHSNAATRTRRSSDERSAWRHLNRSVIAEAVGIVRGARRHLGSREPHAAEERRRERPSRTPSRTPRSPGPTPPSRWH